MPFVRKGHSSFPTSTSNSHNPTRNCDGRSIRVSIVFPVFSRRQIGDVRRRFQKNKRAAPLTVSYAT